jgi:hypothetical protein
VNKLIKGQWDVDNVASAATSLLLVGDNNGGSSSLRKFVFRHKHYWDNVFQPASTRRQVMRK